MPGFSARACPGLLEDEDSYLLLIAKIYRSFVRVRGDQLSSGALSSSGDIPFKVLDDVFLLIDYELDHVPYGNKAG